MTFFTMLYLIGLGLNDEKDISIKGIEAVKKCDLIYLENYTSKLNCSVKGLEKLYEKKIILADRSLIENESGEILKNAKNKDVAILIVGDVFSATTHITLMLDAKKLNVKTKIIHNASILTAIGVIGLELYKYGKVTSIPFENKNIKTPVEAFKTNYKNSLHTLFLLDLDPINNKFMTVNDAADYLIKNKINPKTFAVGCAGIGSDDFEIKSASLEILKSQTFKQFPQCLVIPAKRLHFIEDEALQLWK